MRRQSCHTAAEEPEGVRERPFTEEAQEVLEPRERNWWRRWLGG